MVKHLSPRLFGLEKAPPPAPMMSRPLMMLEVTTAPPSLRDSSEEKWGLLTNRKLGISWAALLFLRLLVLFRVSVIVPVILSLQFNISSQYLQTKISILPNFLGLLPGHVHDGDHPGDLLVIRNDETLADVRGKIHEGFLSGVRHF